MPNLFPPAIPAHLWLVLWLALALPASAQVAPPSFSHASGFHESALELTLSSATPGAEVRYTFDGSIPTDSSALYEGPIPVGVREGEADVLSLIPTTPGRFPEPPLFEAWQPPAGEGFKLTVIRARAFAAGEAPSETVTRSFLVHPLGAARYTLPLLSLVAQPEDLFGDERGIYVPGDALNYEQRGRAWERPAHLDFFEPDGTLVFSSGIGVRIHGGKSRGLPRKSLRLYARSEYGPAWIEHRVFPEKEVSRHKRLLLRNSGQDWHLTLLRDGVLQRLLQGMNVSTQAYRPAVVFINGEYWGIHNIRDRHDERFLQTHFGLDPEGVVILENDAEHSAGDEGGRQHYLDLLALVSDASPADTSVFREVEARMDVDSFIDHVVANVYAMNTDWPGNNIRYWRALREGYTPGAPHGHDGRWRWFVHDTDYGFGLPFAYGGGRGAAHNTLAHALEADGPAWPNPPWSTLLLRRLAENDDFRERFITRFSDALNTRFRPEAVVAAIDSAAAAIAPEMAEHIRRWRLPESTAAWAYHVNVMRAFAAGRPGFVREHLAEAFGLDGTATVALAVDGGGRVRVNTVYPDVEPSWEGTYFLGLPVRLVAEPAAGYRFVGWDGVTAGGDTLSAPEPALTVVLAGDLSVTARFAEDGGGQPPVDAMNPEPFALLDGPFSFTTWSPDEPEGSFPEHMVFLQSDRNDPRLEDEMVAPYHIPPGEYHANDAGSIGFPYRLTGRTRINGLGEAGIAFINTGRGRDLGAAVVALDTRGVHGVSVSWTGGTLAANAREYRIRLQYRVGTEGPFQDVLDAEGEPVEYVRNAAGGHEQALGPTELPADADDQPVVQLRWKYYFAGPTTSGPRDQLRLGDISVDARRTPSSAPDHAPPAFWLGANFPNPASDVTTIPFALPQAAHVSLALYNVLGQRVSVLVDGPLAAGAHHATWSGRVAAGVYLYRLTARAPGSGTVLYTESRRMVVH